MNDTTKSSYQEEVKIEEVKTMFQIVCNQFKDHKLAVMGFIVMAIFMLVALFAPVISSVTGISSDSQDVFNRYKPMGTTITFSSEKREEAIANFYEQNEADAENLKQAMQAKFASHDAEFDFAAEEEEFLLELDEVLLEDKSLISEFAAISNPTYNSFIKLREGFQTYHILGTDELGRDVFMRLVYGARVSIGIGMMVAFAAALIGLIIGSVAGFYGGLIDTVLMRVTDSLLSLPLLPFLIVFAAIDLKKLPIFEFILGSENESIFKLVFILCIFSWMTVARLVRGAILSLKEQEFVYAARMLGAKDIKIILSHMVPNVIAPLLVAVTLNIGQSILSEAALSFLGLGVQPPTPSWGNMLFNAQEIIWEAPSLAILPGLMIAIVVISFNFIGDGLQDAIDPKSIKR